MTMGNQHPDVTDEELGMRTFQIRKARAVERAVERLRQGLKNEWSTLSADEIEVVTWILGEMWAYVARSDWEDLHFSKLTMADVRRLMLFAREITQHTRGSVDVLQDAYNLVVSKG